MRDQRVLVVGHRQQPPVEVEGVRRRARRPDRGRRGRGVRRRACGSLASVTPGAARGGRRSSHRGGRPRSGREPDRPAEPRERHGDVGGAAAGVLVEVDRSASCTMSTRDSPTTSTPRSMCRLYHRLVQWHRVGPLTAHVAGHRSSGSRALVDLVTGLVLSAVGVVADTQVLAIVGVGPAHLGRAACSPSWSGGAAGPSCCELLRLVRRRRRRRRHRRPAATWPATTSRSSRAASTWPGSAPTGCARHRRGPARGPGAATDTAAEVDWSDDTVVLLAVKSHQTEAALADLVGVRTARDARGLRAERRRQRAGHAAPVRPHLRDHGDAAAPSTSNPGVVVQGCHPVPGILDVGRYPRAPTRWPSASPPTCARPASSRCRGPTSWPGSTASS